MQGTIERGRPTLQTGGDGDRPLPPYTANQSNQDGEGDGRLVEEGVNRAEIYANSGTVFELGGVQLAEAVYRVAKQGAIRQRAAIPTGRLAVRREMPVFLN